MPPQQFLEAERQWLTKLAEIIPEIHLMKRQAAEQAGNFPVTPPTTPIFNKSDVRLALLTDRQRELVWYYETFGIVGLCYWIYNIALAFIKQEAEEKGRPNSGTIAHATTRHSSRTKVHIGTSKEDYHPDTDATISDRGATDDADITDSYGETGGQRLAPIPERSDDSGSGYDEVGDGGHKSWRNVRDDFEMGPASRMLYGIASLPPALIPAILYGDLPLRMQDKDFFDQVGAWVDCGDDPGTYAAFVAISTTVQGRHPRVDNYVGKEIGTGPCLEHILKAIETMQLYTNLRDPASREVSKKIDAQYDPAPKQGKYNYEKERKFAGGADHQSFDRLEEGVGWLCQVYHEVEEQIRSTNDLHLMTEPMRSPVYMGMSGNPSSRGPRHKGRPDSKLLGLFLSTLKHLYGDLYEIGPYTYQLFHSVREDDIGFLEVVASILGSGFPWDGGLAYTHAGGRPHGMHEVHKTRMGRAAKMIQASGNIEHNVQDSVDKVERLQRLLNFGQDVFENASVSDDTAQQNHERADDLTAKAEELHEIGRWVELENWFVEYAS